MSSSPAGSPVEKKKLPVVKLAIGGVVLVVGAVLVLRGADGSTLVDRGMALIRGVGPVTFFVAMAVLPAVAVPMSFFTIPAGEAFGPQFGLTSVIVLAEVVLAVNLALTYWVARYALRPLLLGLLKRYGYSVPQVTAATALPVTLVLRLTPGVPYAVQGYVLGVAEVKFGLYMAVSWLCQAPWVVGFIVLGRGLLNGNFMLAMKGLGVMVVAVVAVQLLRKKYARRNN